MPEPLKQEIEGLIRRAVAMRERAYAPYSQFRVGAAILVEGGTMIEGCNVENASYGVGLCAERVAAAAAVAAGFQTWSAIAVASMGGVTPCGACRQFLIEFARDLPVILIDVSDGNHRTVNLGDLLPDAFASTSLPDRKEA